MWKVKDFPRWPNRRRLCYLFNAGLALTWNVFSVAMKLDLPHNNNDYKREELKELNKQNKISKEENQYLPLLPLPWSRTPKNFRAK